MVLPALLVSTVAARARVISHTGAVLSRAFKPSAVVAMGDAGALPQDEAGWRTVLSEKQFAVLRNKATEPPGYSETSPGELEHDLKASVGTKYPQDGAYACVGCGAPLVRTARPPREEPASPPPRPAAVLRAVQVRIRVRLARLLRGHPWGHQGGAGRGRQPHGDRLRQLRRSPGPRLQGRGLPDAYERAPLRCAQRRDRRTVTHDGGCMSGPSLLPLPPPLNPAAGDHVGAVNGISLTYEPAAEQPEDVQQVPPSLRG